jgi:hypothetical protein
VPDRLKVLFTFKAGVNSIFKWFWHAFDTAGEFKRARPETALACAISPAPGSDTPESDSNVRVTLRRWPMK